MPFYPKTFLILLVISAVVIWFTWTVQVPGLMAAYTTSETPLFVLILGLGVAGLSLIPTWIVKEMKSNEIALTTGVASSIILSIIIAIPIGNLAQL